MNDRNISAVEEMINVTDLIGLGETQRRIYETIKKNSQLTGYLLLSYHHHEQELQSLIKYQRTLALR